MAAVVEYRDFYASHDHMPGKGWPLRVTGTVVFATSGWSADLRRTEGNSGINPFMLSLDLVITPPAPGTPVLDVLTPVVVRWSEDDVSTEYTEVEFKAVDPDEKPPPTIPVEHPE